MEVILRSRRQEANPGSETTPQHLQDASPPWQTVHSPPSQAEPRTCVARGSTKQVGKLGRLAIEDLIESKIKSNKCVG